VGASRPPGVLFAQFKMAFCLVGQGAIFIGIVGRPSRDVDRSGCAQRAVGAPNAQWYERSPALSAQYFERSRCAQRAILRTQSLRSARN